MGSHSIKKEQKACAKALRRKASIKSKKPSERSFILFKMLLGDTQGG